MARPNQTLPAPRSPSPKRGGVPSPSIDAGDLALFASVAEAGSISAAARLQGLPKSTVSRRLSGLETALGERLFLRDTRRSELTPFGRGVLQHAKAVATEVEEVAAFAQGSAVRPTGRLRVFLMADLSTRVLPGMLTEFVQTYPGIQLEIEASPPRKVDLVTEQFDLVLMAAVAPNDPGHAVRRMAEIDLALYASPEYLRARGIPSRPDDLADHRWLLLPIPGDEPGTLRLLRGEPGKEEIWKGIPASSTRSNSPALLSEMAMAGCGVACLPDLYVHAPLASGRLVRVLPDWRMARGAIWAIFPERHLMPARTRVFLDALGKHLSKLSERIPLPSQPAKEKLSKTIARRGTPKERKASTSPRRTGGEAQR